MRSCSPKSLLNHPRLVVVLVYITNIYVGYTTYMSVRRLTSCTIEKISCSLMVNNNKKESEWFHIFGLFIWVWRRTTRRCTKLLIPSPLWLSLKVALSFALELTIPNLTRIFSLFTCHPSLPPPSLSFAPKILIGWKCQHTLVANDQDLLVGNTCLLPCLNILIDWARNKSSAI